jgi:hypothetical protein
MASGRRLRLRPTFETAAETVARFRTVDASIRKGDPRKRQLRKLPAPRYVISRPRPVISHSRGVGLLGFANGDRAAREQMEADYSLKALKSDESER